MFYFKGLYSAVTDHGWQRELERFATGARQMGIAVGVMVLLVAGYLLAAALQKPAMIKPYVAVFVVAGLLALAAQVLAGDFASQAEWTMMAAKLLAALSCLALCVHLAVLVVRRLMAGGPPQS